MSCELMICKTDELQNDELQTMVLLRTKILLYYELQMWGCKHMMSLHTMVLLQMMSCKMGWVGAWNKHAKRNHSSHLDGFSTMAR